MTSFIYNFLGGIAMETFVDGPLLLMTYSDFTLIKVLGYTGYALVTTSLCLGTFFAIKDTKNVKDVLNICCTGTGMIMAWRCLHT